MVSIKSSLLKLLTDKTAVCCLCLRNVDNKCFSIHDSIILEYSNKNFEIEATELLNQILGYDCLQDVTTNIICHHCLAMSVKCFKFIKSCKENAKYLRSIINLMENLSDSKTGLEQDGFKTMFITINGEKITGKQYCDEKSANGNNIFPLKQLKAISSCNKKSKSTLSGKENKKKPRNIKDDLVDQVPASQILYHEDQLSTFKCKQCDKVFSRLHNLKKHFIRVHAPKHFVCSKCNKSFGSPALLEEHRVQSHSGNKLICIECGKIFAFAQSLKLHELSHKLTLQCAACGKIFNRKKNYWIHVNTRRCDLVQKKTLEQKYICDYCNKKYTTKGALKVHIQFEHGNMYNHVCSWCGKKFSSTSRLKLHTVTHTQEKNFSCEICGGCFVSKASLLYHTRRHTGEKPYKCDQCDQSFLSSSRRAQHVRFRHMDPTLECDVCHAKFKVRTGLLRHKKRHFNPNSRLHYTKLAEVVQPQ